MLRSIWQLRTTVRAQKGMELDEFIIFGTTPRAKHGMEFLCYCHLDHMVQAFCALKKELHGRTIMEKPVLLWDEASAKNVPFFLASDREELTVARWLLSSSGSSYRTNLMRLLTTEFGMDATELNRQYCSFVHENHMESYYDWAEGRLDLFWSPDTVFYRMFSSLDLTNVVELACGHGRHTEKYIDRAGSVTLVDVLEKNIAFCKERLSGKDNIRFYTNNGYDLSELDDESCTALFSYDSMVHFELFDIHNYLKETRRVLKKGGRALFHHSNMALVPDQSFYRPHNNGGRSYMSKDLFAYLSYQAGLDVIEQQVIDWNMPEMDCVTLLEKN